MTIIAAIRAKDGIWMGADSQGTDPGEKVILRNPKVFTKGPFTIAFAGKFRFGQVLQYNFQPPERLASESAESYLLVRWLDALRQCLADTGLLKIEDGIQELEDCSALVAYEDLMFQLQDDLAVLFPDEPFIASGAGAAYALGAFHAVPFTGRKALEAALRSAIKCSPQCRGAPLVIKHSA